MQRLGLFFALLARLAWLGTAAQQRSATALPIFPVVQFSAGQRLEELQGYEVLMPRQRRTEINISLTPATIQGPVGSPTMLQFTNGLYRDDSTGRIHLFGPTIRMKGGDSLLITLQNDMLAPGPDSKSENGFRDPAHTNIHTHGLHASPGVRSQETATRYEGEDNIFLTIPPKSTPDAEPAVLPVTGSIPEDHMPGLHWYHPHKHGSTALQAFTANGLILVEDNPAWLLDANGCGEVRGILESAPDVILHLGLLTFSPARDVYVQFFGQRNADLEDSSPQFISEASDPQNDLCCNGTGQITPSLPLLGSANSTDIVLVNGGWQPVIGLQSGQYQRWRLANTGYRRVLDLQILDQDTQLPTDQCELLLLAKDGLYLMELPRQVDHIFLSNGNRGELLVKCAGEPGQRYVLAAGAVPSPFGANFSTSAGGFESLVQPVVAIIEIEAPEVPEQPTPELKGCIPLRPSYAPDLRDEALEAYNATGLITTQEVGFTFQQGWGCLVNGKNFSLPDPEPIELPLGHVAEWRFGNPTLHPVHLHINPMQIIRLPPEFLVPGLSYTTWFEEGDWMDTIQLPIMRADKVTSVVLRTQPGEFSGYTVMHCHRLNHEDMGCMKVVKYTCPGYGETQPLECPDFEYPVPGTFF